MQWTRTGDHYGFSFPSLHTRPRSPRQRKGEFEANQFPPLGFPESSSAGTLRRAAWEPSAFMRGWIPSISKHAN
jgi:hypothetical protein